LLAAGSTGHCNKRRIEIGASKLLGLDAYPTDRRHPSRFIELGQLCADNSRTSAPEQKTRWRRFDEEKFPATPASDVVVILQRLNHAFLGA
jgi:hypothetical protein